MTRTMTRGLIILLSLAVCAQAAAADPEVHVLPVADRAPGERLPLLLYLHGLGGSGAEALANPELRALAQRHRMVLVAPDGNLDREGRRFWNAGGACCNFDGKAVNDVARLEALIYHWTQRPEIDPARVYVVGFSNGGFMAHRLACYMDDRLAAIVSIGGAGRAPEEACAPVSTIAVLEIHGDADPIVRYGGGHVLDNRAADPHPSAPETFHDWAERLGCPTEAKAKDERGRSRSAAPRRRDDDRELRRLSARQRRALDRSRRRAPGGDARHAGAGGRVPGQPSEAAAQEEAEAEAEAVKLRRGTGQNVPGSCRAGRRASCCGGRPSR